jgi:hypothetical protein
MARYSTETQTHFISLYILLPYIFITVKSSSAYLRRQERTLEEAIIK